MKNQYIIGVDLGLNGGIALLNDKKLIEYMPMPISGVLVGKKLKRQYDISKINKIISDFITNYPIGMAGMERLRAIPNQSSQTAFSMGGATMLFKVLFTIYKIPFIEIEPRNWQKKIFGQLGIQYTKETTKIASIQATKQLFPGEDFRANERCRTDSDGITDAILIGLFTSDNSLK